MANTHSLDLELSSSQYASITDASQTGLDITGDITIECWVKPESFGVIHYYVTKWQSSGDNRSYAVAYTSSTLRFYASADGTFTSAAANIASVSHSLSTGVWTHLATTFDASAGSAEFFVNGSSVGTDTITTTSLYNGSSEFAIGAYDTNATPTSEVDGLMDDVRVWNDIRTGTEISDNYNTELVGNEAGLVGYWKLNNDYTDSTSNGNDLTASGSPVFSTDVPFSGGGGGVNNPLFLGGGL